MWDGEVLVLGCSCSMGGVLVLGCSCGMGGVLVLGVLMQDG